MLKSRFNLAQTTQGEETSSDAEPDAEPEPAPDNEEHGLLEHMGEGEGEGAAEEEEKRVIYDMRKLKRAEVSVRLSVLGLTADGDG